MTELIERVGLPMFIQLIIEVWNELILLMLTGVMLVGKSQDKHNELMSKTKIPLTNELIIFYLAAFFYNMFDIITRSLGNVPSSEYLYKTCVFMYYAVGGFQTLLLLEVIKKYVAEKAHNELLKKCIIGVQLLNIANYLLLIATPFTETIYSIDENNTYVRAWGYYIWQGVTIASFVFILVVLLAQRKNVDKYIKHVFIVAAIVPVFGITGGLFVSKVSLNNIMVTLSALLIYMIYERNKTEITVQNAYELEKTRVELIEKQLVIEQNKQELQENKIRLLVAQIQPHFIFNSLMALQAKCTDNPELYNGINSFGKYLRANFEAMTDNDLIPFTDELKNIKAYVQLEMMNYGDKLRVEYDIELDQFMLPAFCVEPLVENAIRYGVGTYEKDGLVQIMVRDEPDCIQIEVKDDGSGGNRLTDAQEGRKSIGLENVRLRLKALDMGELSVSQDESGTSAVIRLKYLEENSENDYD